MSLDWLTWLFSPQMPGGTIAVLLISMGISFLNAGVYRLLITKMVGWKEYRKLQNELKKLQNEFRQILRSKDQEALEKFEKKRRRMLQIQARIMKPQGYLFILGFSYILVWWFFLIPTYGAAPLAVIPGFMELSVVWWYFLCSALFGTLSYRVFGIIVEEEEEK
ncbi:hypothetical protein DRO54_00200 [Candidatus Bathyarchaeota archaeon]|nr:MAG: hypothetical protein DRO54_00200 [Candidatus Bathyarchaeota archaeon]